MEKISLNMYVTEEGKSIYTMRELSNFEMSLSALQHPTMIEAEEAKELGEILDEYAEGLLGAIPVNGTYKPSDTIRFEVATQLLAIKMGFDKRPKGPIEQQFDSEGFSLDEVKEDTANICSKLSTS